MKKFILFITAIVVFKISGRQTRTFKAMKEHYLKEKEEWEKHVKEMQKELDRDHRNRLGWDSTTLSQSSSNVKA